MTTNEDFLKTTEIEKIFQISRKEKISMAAIGRICEIEDRSFWHRICNGKKPIPEHSRNALEKFLKNHKED